MSTMEEQETGVIPDKPKAAKSANKRTLIVIAVALLVLGASAAVWFWRQRDIDRLKAKQGSTTQTTPKDNTSGANLIDPADTDNWSQVLLGPALLDSESGSPATGGLAFRLPIGWTVKQCSGGGGLVAYVSPTSDTQAACNSEGSSPFVIAVQNGDYADAYDYSDDSIYSDRKSETVKVGGKDFTRSSATIAHPIEFQPPAGSRIVSYYNVTSGVTYSATYVYVKGDSRDLTFDFIEIVEKTLSIFNP
jgi:hypothetical protein